MTKPTKYCKGSQNEESAFQKMHGIHWAANSGVTWRDLVLGRSSAEGKWHSEAFALCSHGREATKRTAISEAVKSVTCLCQRELK